MDAFPLHLAAGPTNPRWLLGGMAIAMVAILSIWLLVVAGLEAGGMRDVLMPGPIPEGPTMVQTDLAAIGAEVVPAPGVEILPMDGGVSPR
ncbi:MAG TPA: hypothetical protein VEW95_12600 [Candidatus Limnocylindrales bacterium]|nr:hypothetical protein [Candidatus Limnocylindrales bacterium]